MQRIFAGDCFCHKPLIEQYDNIISSRLIIVANHLALLLVGDIMRHNWIIDVLADLQAYAELNNLAAIAVAAEQTLAVARAEIAALAPEGVDTKPDMG